MRTRVQCWPVWIWDPSDWNHHTPYMGYVADADKGALERVMHDIAGFLGELDYQIGLDMQEQTDTRVPWPIRVFVARAIKGWMPDADERADLGRLLARHGLWLVGREGVEEIVR